MDFLYYQPTNLIQRSKANDFYSEFICPEDGLLNVFVDALPSKR